jgi:protein-disulfide isomerase
VKGNTVVMAGALALLLGTSSVFAEDMQKKDIEKIVHDYLVTNPEVLLEASQALQQKQQNTMQQQAQSAIRDNIKPLIGDGKLAVVGNPKGDVTIIEFFDYQCVHCKRMLPVLSEITNKDKSVRIIYKEFPIFGKTSDLASRAALAASLQGKYSQMHDALLKIEDHLKEATVMDAAKNAGLDMTKLKADMDSKQVTEALKANRELAEKLRLMGTPAFIVLSTPGGNYKPGSEAAFVPGLVSAEALQGLINKAKQ